ncbi:MAG: ATP-binding cassette domain-containing protein, partial [Selenomonas sp.]|nr:ATP-binding cassette domain-containing protein [Selenomonas sp.]
MIQLKDVSKVYENGTVALDHVSIDIGKGEFVFLVGASGAGKSTFIKLLLREELPTAGEIRVAGRNVVTMPRREVP